MNIRDKFAIALVILLTLAPAAMGCNFCKTPNVKAAPAPAPAPSAPPSGGAVRVLPAIKGGTNSFSDDFFSNAFRAPAEETSERGTFITTTPASEIYGN